MKTNSIRFKTSVFYSGVLTAILAAFSLYLFGTVRQVLYQETRHDLWLKAGQIEGFLNAYAFMSPKESPSAYFMNQFLSASDETASRKWIIDHLWQQDSKSLGLRDDFFRILSPRGRERLRSNNLTDAIDRQINARFPRDRDAVRFRQLQINGAPFYGINYPFTFSHRNAFVLQLATPLDSVERVLSRLVAFIILGVVAILLMTVFMGSFLTRRILKPVSDVTKTADNISQTNLHLRLPQQKLDHEMEQLVASFNRMIGRLEESFSHVNDFSSHVAHELKTPLAVIKSELELALAQGNAQDGQRAMRTALEEIDRLVKIIKDMLLLAKLEYKLNIFKMEDIDLTAFFEEIYQYIRILADEKGIGLQWNFAECPVWVHGDPVHLRRVFFNLLHNAVKFTPVGGRIEVSCRLGGHSVLVMIKDTGIGIPKADQTHIFEKFYRVRRPDQPEGSGLGLCMARAIAKSHGGGITFESELDCGSTFTVVLPVLPLASLHANLTVS